MPSVADDLGGNEEGGGMTILDAIQRIEKQIDHFADELNREIYQYNSKIDARLSTIETDLQKCSMSDWE